MRLREAGIKRNVQELNVLNFGLKASKVMNEKLLTPEQVAEGLQVTERTVYGWLRRGTLPALKLGRLWRVRPEDLEAFLENARAKAP